MFDPKIKIFMAEALIIFIKNPVLGKVKTRIAATVGEELALKVYVALLNYTRKFALKVQTERLLYYDAYIPTSDEWQLADFQKFVQTGNDLGERMKNAFTDALAIYEKAIIVGSDCTTLHAHHIQTAFQALDSCDLVLGPSSDGGYYLLGMKQLLPTLFEDIPWSTTQVLPITMERIKEADKSFFLLPELTDIDYWEDWEEFGWKL
jgi:rSAM/selenodomain-associated transferase 1